MLKPRRQQHGRARQRLMKKTEKGGVKAGDTAGQKPKPQTVS